MAKYYIDKLPDKYGGHVVHASGCLEMPVTANRFYLGTFNSCQNAVIAAHRFYKKIEGCRRCCPELEMK